MCLRRTMAIATIILTSVITAVVIFRKKLKEMYVPDFLQQTDENCA